ncbi:MAG: sensor histidine kinase [Lachnospiraceae bacterium]
MKSDYERKQFRNKYWKYTIFFLCLLFAALVYGFQGIHGYVVMILFVSLIGLSILYVICYGYIDKICGEVERVSEQMQVVMETNKEPDLGEYQEGSVGILYSNFEKMVCVLQKSREKELNEKIFLRDIISDISHQLKTPLASLNVFMDLLLEDKVEDKEKQKQILKEAENQLSRMEWMVLSMLKLARIEAGAIQFDKKEQLLLPILLQAKEGVLYLTTSRNQNLTVICDENCKLSCDGDWLVEAIINLLKNASDYSGENQSITVEVEYSNVYTRIYIKDEGIGIAEDEIPNIFKRFYRVNREVNPNSVGIGLSLTKSIVEGMGGTIRVQSEVSKYTWFVITFVK